ncbi:MAG: DEAD/DEAH box helicase [Thermoplasmataceae archaeon]
MVTEKEESYDLNGVEPRKYQLNIARESIGKNSLVVLPTGLGKTIIAAMLASKAMENGRKVILVAPTRPLVDQHVKTFTEIFKHKEWIITGLTGHTKMSERKKLWLESRMVISTPQTVQGDIGRELVNLNEYGLLVVDEAHRAIGNYAYVEIAKAFMEKSTGYILAITASPGSKKEHIEGIKDNLEIRKVIIKTEDDPDVEPYVMGSDITAVYVDPDPNQVNVSIKLRSVKINQLQELSSKVREINKYSSKRELTDIIRKMSARAVAGEKQLFSMIPHVTACVRLDILCEYSESQGLELANDYLLEMEQSEDKSIMRTISLLEKNHEFISAKEEMRKAMNTYVNGKFKKALELAERKVGEGKGSKIIIFTHYRKTSQFLIKYLKENSTILKPLRFVGQSSRKGEQGMTQKVQRDGIEKFREGIYNVLVATSVAEEGLDIPATDMVIFYEPVPSEIRSIQRRGRTGRFSVGEVFIFVFKNGRDIAYYNSSVNKEKSMLGKMKKEMETRNDVTLMDFS